MVNNKTYQYKFDSAFPIKDFTPFEIQFSNDEDYQYTFEEGLKLLRQHQQKEGQLISMYGFHVKEIIQSTIKGLKEEGIDFQIYHSVIER